MPSRGAQWASAAQIVTPPSRASSRPRAGHLPPIVRLLGGALAIGLLLMAPQVARPEPARAACGTGWDSRLVPPETIRVLRTRTGTVDTVNFRRYVAIVMASGEWPSRLPAAALEVGAVAVKQFAWYYALEGHHRDWYRTSSGACYDVRDDTADQLYRPGSAEPTAKQQAAIEKTWGLTLRKNDRFFLTGYRFGSDVPCGADADGWHLYEQSVVDCAARLGWGRQRIQEKYYAPNVRFVWAESLSGTADDPGPDVTKPRLRLTGATTYGEKVGTVRWSGQPDGAAIKRYRLQRSVDGGDWRDVDLPDPLATSVPVGIMPWHAYRFRVRARDTADEVSDWTEGPEIRGRLVQSGDASLRGSGWQLMPDEAALGGSAHRSSVAGDRASLGFSGRSVAIIAPRGPDLGEVRIRVDGEIVATLDLQAPEAQARQLVWVRNWRETAWRRVSIEVLGTPDRETVEVDAFLVLR